MHLFYLRESQFHLGKLTCGVILAYMRPTLLFVF